MRRVFADAGFYIALLNRNDQLHEAAKEAARQLAESRHITSEMVLVEVLAYFSASGPSSRGAAATLCGELRQSRNTEVVPQTSDLFRRAVALYHERTDKEWSLVDCASMLIMEDREVFEVLGADHHFVQAGFTLLMSRG